MKKFKHRKTGEIATYKDGVLKSSGFAIELGVEPSSEYWEEVIEKDYKILSLARFCSIKPKITDVSDYGDGYIEALLKCDNARIHSVKRKDGEIFSIGDKVRISKLQHDGSFTIDEFYFDCNNDKLLCNGKCTGNGHVSIIKIEHYKQPIFKTEDGVDIFEGDEYYYVDGYYLSRKSISSKTLFTDKRSFSTKEKAEEFVVLNKPCLSINNVFDTLHYSPLETRDNLIKLVKSKL